jgi:hypothetical protein
LVTLLTDSPLLSPQTTPIQLQQTLSLDHAFTIELFVRFPAKSFKADKSLGSHDFVPFSRLKDKQKNQDKTQH